MLSGPELISKYQCPGCVAGSDAKSCESFYLSSWGDGVYCKSWVPGTTAIPGGVIALGLPVGFNKGHEAYRTLGFGKREKITLALFGPEGNFEFNDLNVPVWALDMDEACFVRMFMPRINAGMVLVFEGQTRAEVCPLAANVADLVKGMD